MNRTGISIKINGSGPLAICSALGQHHPIAHVPFSHDRTSPQKKPPRNTLWGLTPLTLLASPSPGFRHGVRGRPPAVNAALSLWFWSPWRQKQPDASGPGHAYSAITRRIIKLMAAITGKGIMARPVRVIQMSCASQPFWPREMM